MSALHLILPSFAFRAYYNCESTNGTSGLAFCPNSVICIAQERGKLLPPDAFLNRKMHTLSFSVGASLVSPLIQLRVLGSVVSIRAGPALPLPLIWINWPTFKGNRKETYL